MSTAPIIIMTYKHASLDQQLTWNTLTPSLKKRVIFAVRPEEEKFFMNLSEVFVLPKSVKDFKSTRQVIWDHFNSTTDVWFLLDDDIRSIQGVNVLNTADQFCENVELDDAGMVKCFDVLEAELRNGNSAGPVGTTSPRASTKPPNSETHPSWSHQLVIGFNGFNSKLCSQANVTFHSNAFGDQECLLYLLSHGFDTTFRQDYKYLLAPPTKKAEFRRDVKRESEEYVSRWSDVIRTSARKRTWATKVDPEDTDIDLVFGHYKQHRAALLKSARAGLRTPGPTLKRKNGQPK